jgi:hypothetical protein
MKYTLEPTKTRTGVGATTNYIDSYTVVKLPWYRRLWRWFK